MVTEQRPAAAPDDAVVQLFPPGKLASPLKEKVTTSPPAGLPSAPVTDAVALEVDEPSGGSSAGSSETVTEAGRGVSTNVAVPVPASTPDAVAVIVSWSAVVEALTVAEHAPFESVVHGLPDGKVTSPVVAKDTVSLGSVSPVVLSVTVAETVEREAPSASTLGGDNDTATAAAPGSAWAGVAETTVPVTSNAATIPNRLG